MPVDVVITGAVVRSKCPVDGLVSRKHVLRVASVVVTVGATFREMVASLLSHKTEVGSLMITEIFVSVLYWKLAGLAIGVPLPVI